LTETGDKQAEALAGALVGREIAFLYSSDLGRALRTARPIAEALSLNIIRDERLRERHLGPMQGMTMKAFEAQYPEAASAVKTGDPDYAPPRGESIRRHYRRCCDCAEELAERHPGVAILIVCHGGVLRNFFYRTLNIPLTEPRRFSLFNAGINEFSITDGQWKLETWGDIHHLRSVRS
jgi:probable phosphoglycerate mutase